MIVCIAEDRKSCEAAVKLTLVSLTAHCSQISVELFYPPADEAFRSWLSRCPQVKLNTEPISGAYGWNVKPQALLALLQRGHDDVLWIDSDILVTRDFRPLISGMGPDTTVLTEEALYGFYGDPDGMRARKWGFEVGRSLPFTVNTGVMRVTKAHVPLLERWKTLLESDVYRSAQRLGWSERPVHMFGDQDVLTALLASREFSGVPVVFLRRGKDIVQYFGPYGYTCAERIGHVLHGPPAFLHSQVAKPWAQAVENGSPRNLREYFDALYLDVSPYTLAARKYEADLGEDERGWMRPRLRVGAALRALGAWRPPLTGLPLAVIADVVRLGKKVLRLRSR